MGIPHHSEYGEPRRVGSAAVYAYGPFKISLQRGAWIVQYAHRTDLVSAQPSFEAAIRGADLLAELFESKYIDAGSTWRRLIVPFTKPSTSDRRRLVEASKMFYAKERPDVQLVALGFALGRLQYERELEHVLDDGHTYRLEVFPATGAIKEPSNPKYGAVFIPNITNQPDDGMYHDGYRITRVARPNRNHLPGGRAAHLNPRNFDPRALAIGTKHELEHTSDKDIAQEIAMDHLAEYPHYYDMLGELERTYPQRYPQDVPKRDNRKTRATARAEQFEPSEYVEFPREIAEQVMELRSDLWAKHGTGGNPPTRWTGDDAYKAWEWWIDLREGRTPPASDQKIAKEAYAKLTGDSWAGPASELFSTVVSLWLRKRENYVSRHRKDFRPGGTVAMIKWAAVFPWAEEDMPGQGYKAMLETLGLQVDKQSNVSSV